MNDQTKGIRPTPKAPRNSVKQDVSARTTAALKQAGVDFRRPRHASKIQIR